MQFRFKISGLGIKSGREWLTLLFSLLFAFLLWLIHNLSSDYSSFLKYRLSVEATLPDRTSVAVSEGNVVLSGTANGYYLVRNRMMKLAPVENVRFDSKLLKPYGNDPDRFYVLGKEIFNELSQSLKDRVTLESVWTDTIVFSFPRQDMKRVPVVFDYDITYRSQYMPFEDFHFNHDSVTVYGDMALLENIEEVHTERVVIENLAKDVQGISPLRKMEGVRFSVGEIYFSQPVGRYVENSVMVPLNVSNLPADKEMIMIPSEIKVVYRQPFDLKVQYSASDFIYTVDYNEYLVSKTSKVKPRPVMLPDRIYSVEVHPPFVECLLR